MEVAPAGEAGRAGSRRRVDAERAAAPDGGSGARTGGAGAERALGLDGQGREKRMTGGVEMSVEKMEAEFNQPTGVDAYSWVSKFKSGLLNGYLLTQI